MFGGTLTAGPIELLELVPSEKQPDVAKLQRWMKRYLVVIATQGTMQIAIIVIMARFVSGL